MAMIKILSQCQEGVFFMSNLSKELMPMIPEKIVTITNPMIFKIWLLSMTPPTCWKIILGLNYI